MSADYCIRSKNVYLGGDDLPAPACVYVCGKTIESVGGYEPDPAKMDSHTSILDMGEKLVMPGLIDAHTHFFAGAISESRYVVSDLGLCSSEEECAEKVAAFAKANPDLKRIRGAGWFITNWGKGAKLPTKKSLDRLLPDIPVYLKAADAHSFWVNSAALKECGVTKETTVSTGFIGRFPDGEPDGMLVEYEAASYAEAKFSDFTPAELKEIYLSMLDKAAAMGVTALSEMMPDDYDGPAGERLKIIKEIDEEGKLPLTLSIYPTLFNSGNFDNFFALKDQYDSENIKIAGVKGFIDGVVETYTGYLLEPYSDRPDTCGIGVPTISRQVLQDAVLNANKRDIPVRIHCIADGSVRMALDAFEYAEEKTGKVVPNNTIEHVENIHPDDIGRFKKLHIIPSMQPIHILLDNLGKLPKIGPERIKYEWPTKTLLDRTGILAIGTDFPVVPLDPFMNIYAAVTRNFADGSPASCNPEEKLTMLQTLKGYTSSAAYAYGLADKIGSLKAGYAADIIALDRNLFDTPAEDIPETKVELTMRNGKVLYQPK